MLAFTCFGLAAHTSIDPSLFVAKQWIPSLVTIIKMFELPQERAEAQDLFAADPEQGRTKASRTCTDLAFSARIMLLFA